MSLPLIRAIRSIVATTFLAVVSFTAVAAEPTKLTLTSHGAAGQVPGSMHILDTGNGRWMIDCGAVIGKKQSSTEGDPAQANPNEDRSPAQRLPSGVETVNALFLTHAHVDHLGRLPLLIGRGFAGPIYTTPATAVLAVPMLRVIVRNDQAAVRDWTWSKDRQQQSENSRKSLWLHWHPCKYQSRIQPANLQRETGSLDDLRQRFQSAPSPVKVTPCEECIQLEVQKLLANVRPAKYGEPQNIAPGIQATFLDAGHIPGSASILFEIQGNFGKRRVVFSGDLGNGLSPLSPLPSPVPPADALIVETTYGAITRKPTVAHQRDELRRKLGEAIARNGVVWIPCFSLDRTQKILYEIHLAQQEKRLPTSLPIYCPSPTAKEATKLYREHQRDGWFPAAIADDPLAFAPSDLRPTVPSAKVLPKPCIIISTSDLVSAIWMRRLLASILPEKTTEMFLVGYQDPDSLGLQLLRGVQSVEIDGKPVAVRAAVHSFSCFSGHGDASDIDQWLSRTPKTAQIVLVHGDPSELDARAKQLGEHGYQHVTIAQPEAAIDLLK